MWVSERAVAIVDPELAARVWDGEAQEAVIRFLATFGDRFDFVQIHPTGRGSPSYAARHSSVVNAVEGIGSPLFNNRDTLGLPPDGKIIGYHWQNNSPGPGASTHEIMHQWQAFAGYELGLGQCAGVHWGILGQGRGVMGGFDPTTLIKRSTGLYEVGYFSSCCGVGQLYTPLELYFAGLAPASEVPPMMVPVNADCGSLDCVTTQGKCTFKAEGMKTVTIEELIELEGPRNPGYGAAPAHFTYAHVLVTDVPPSQAELSTIEEKAWILEDPESDFSFYRISGGRGTIDTLIGDVVPGFKINAGHAGAWFNEDTAGQGQLIDVVPETQYMFLAWFTFTAAASNTPDQQHWYTAQGNYSGNTAELILYETLGGQFDNPKETSTNPVGTVTLSFTDCEHGRMVYNIDTDGRHGTVPLERAVPGSHDVCEKLHDKADNNTQAVDINAGMDGSWANEDTLGQGFLIDAHPNPDGDNFIFVGWFTYGDDTASGLRWLTAQGDFEGSTAEIDIYETIGGRFDDPQTVEVNKVGTMAIDFTDCSNANLSYSLTDDGLAGDMAISRLIPGGQALCEELAGVE